MRLVHRARRFFPPGSAAEIWAELGPALQDVERPDAYEALGWLSALMPTHAALRRDGAWGAWARAWLGLWGRVAHCRYWDSLWFGMFARLAKHDLHGLVDWGAVAPEVFAHAMWVFHVPVGTATADSPFTGSAPALCESHFANEMRSRGASVAKAAVYTLARVPGGGPHGDVALTWLEGVATLLEQYYHPSNGGRWGCRPGAHW